MLINDAAVAAVEGVFLYTKGVSVQRNVTQVCIHHSVKHIPECAFRECNTLVDVKLHDGLRMIGMLAFDRCISLISIIIPSSVTFIGNEAFIYCTALLQVELHEGLQRIGAYAFSGCCSLLYVKIPSSTTSIGDNAFEYHLLRNVTISSTSAITQEEFASSFPTLRKKKITLDLIKGRFDEMSLHRLCNNYNPALGTQAEVQARCESFIQAVNQHSVKEFQRRDCLGMTPFHILLCSGRDYDMCVIQCMIEKCPDAMLIQDKWGEVPLDYALLGNASVAVEVLDFLFETHSKRWEDMPFDFGNTIQRLAIMNKPAQFVRDVIRVQRTHFPGLAVDWQEIVAQSLISQHDTNGIPIGTFRVFVEASLSVRRYNCMSDEHRIEVDTRIDKIKYRHRVNDYEEICEMVTRYVEAHHALLQEVGITLVRVTMPTDTIKQVLSFL